MTDKISNVDKIIIQNRMDQGENPYAVAEDLGYIVDGDLVFEMITNGIGESYNFLTTMRMIVEPDCAKRLELRDRVVDKLKSIYGDDVYALTALAFKYDHPRTRLSKTFVDTVTVPLNLPKYFAIIAQEIMLNRCINFEDIDNFELGEEDEKVRRDFGLSGTTETG